MVQRVVDCAEVHYNGATEVLQSDGDTTEQPATKEVIKEANIGVDPVVLVSKGSQSNINKKERVPQDAVEPV